MQMLYWMQYNQYGYFEQKFKSSDYYASSGQKYLRWDID